MRSSVKNAPGRHLFFWMLGLVLAASIGCGDPPPPPLNVVVITLDTTRADALGCYGNEKIETPNIDALSASGVQFENALAPNSMTMPSHTTLFTSMWPYTHGIRDNGIFRLSDRAVTWAELLSEQDYRTGAIVSAFVLDSQFGLDQGFDHYDDRVHTKVLGAAGTQDRNAKDVTDEGLAFIDKDKDAPFFLWLHYFDAHAPYAPPPPFRDSYRENLYYGELASIDAEIGRFLQGLKSRGVRENTLIVLTADHGESLGEHGEQTHGYFVYDSTLHIPLIVQGQGWPAGKKVDSVVRLVDVLPSILETLNLETPVQCQGESLLDAATSPEADTETRLAYFETYLPYFNFGWSPLDGFREDDLKYIRAPEPELYDVGQDPGETTNLHASRPDDAQRMSQKLDELLKAAGQETYAESVDVSPEGREQLAQIGYFASPAAAPKRGGPDPKAMIHLLEYRDQGRHFMQRGKPEKAIAPFQKILAENPTNSQVREFLGTALLMLNRIDDAKEQFTLALKERPHLYVSHYNLAQCYRVAKDRQQYRHHLRKAYENNPTYVEPTRDLALDYAATGEWDLADQWFEKAQSLLSGSEDLFNQFKKRYDDQRRRAPAQRQD